MRFTWGMSTGEQVSLSDFVVVGDSTPPPPPPPPPSPTLLVWSKSGDTGSREGEAPVESPPPSSPLPRRRLRPGSDTNSTDLRAAELDLVRGELRMSRGLAEVGMGEVVVLVMGGGGGGGGS